MSILLKFSSGWGNLLTFINVELQAMASALNVYTPLDSSYTYESAWKDKTDGSLFKP